MMDEGKTIAEIASEFGITQTLVKKRLKLAGVAPEIIAHYRKGKIDLEAVMAFTVSDEHDKQLACYKELSCHYMTAWKIKRYLLDDKISTDDALVKFVTLKAFKKAGGTITTDLFESNAYINERELLESLVLQKLEAEATKIKGWKWVKVDLTHKASDYAGQLQAEYVDVPDTLIKSLEDKQAAINTLYDKAEWTDEDIAMEQELTAEIEALESKREEYRAFTDEQKAVSGIVISLNYQGEVTLHQGLVNKEDKNLAFPKQEKALNGHDADNIESGALKNDLHNFKLQALQSEIMKDDKLAYDVMVFSVAVKFFSQYYAAAPLDISVDTFNLSSTKGIDETASYKAIEDMKAALELSWLSLDEEGQKFAAFRGLTARQKKQILSFCTAQSYRFDVSEGINEVVTTQLDFTIGKHWTPNKDNYFNRVKKDALLTIAKEHIGEEWTAQHTKLPKGKLAMQLEAHKDMADWMPQSMM